MEEKIFFADGDISVSNTRFTVCGQTYAMSAVTSVKQTVINPSYGLPGLLGIAGIFICFIGNIASIVAGLAAICLAIFVGSRRKPEYIVVLNTSSGESQALKSYDKAHVENVVAALNNSIIHRG